MTLRLQRRNFICFILDAAVFTFALSFVDLSSVMPSLLGHLTREPVLIGVLGSVQTGSWLLPQFLAARVVAARHRKKPTVVVSTTISRLGWCLLIVALAFYREVGPTVTLIAAYLSVGVFMFFDGVASLAWYDLIARAVPPTIRGRLFGSMSFSGGLLAVLGGLVVQRILGSVGFPFPTDYRVLAVVALVLFTVGVLPLLLIVEPPGDAPKPTEPLGQYLRRLPGLVRSQPGFRRLVGTQLLVGASGMAVPFYAPFAVLRLGLPESDVGGFVVGVTLGIMAGGGLWGYLGDRHRKEVAIRLLAACGLLAPLLTLTLGTALVRSAPPAVVGALLVVSFFFLGCAIRAGWVAYANYVIEIAEPSERPVLIGLMNTLSGVLAVAPPIGGLLAGLFGYEAAFAAAAVCAGAGLAVSLGLKVAEAPGVKSEHLGRSPG
ncbi:MAG: MFS transporter [Chloroflexota bacterium]